MKADRKGGEYDVAVVGGGPAGLSAAMLLGRARRRVLLCDAGSPRNAASRALHGFLTRDGVAPAELLRMGREELAAYDAVELVRGEVADVRREGKSFRVALGGGAARRCRRVLLATGLVDDLPAVPGARELYGRGVFHCPYCDGWEVRDRPLAAYGKGKGVLGLAAKLKRWSGDVVVLTDGPPGWRRRHRAAASRLKLRVREEPVARLEGAGGLERVVFAAGDVLPRSALFFSTGQRPASGLAERLGCERTRKGSVRCDRAGRTSVPGVYVAGDASRDVLFAVVAAAEGARAALAIDNELLREDGLAV